VMDEPYIIMLLRDLAEHHKPGLFTKRETRERKLTATREAQVILDAWDEDNDIVSIRRLFDMIGPRGRRPSVKTDEREHRIVEAVMEAVFDGRTNPCTHVASSEALFGKVDTQKRLEANRKAVERAIKNQ